MSGENIAGVAAVFYIPGMPEKGCPTLEELRTKRSTNKIASQRTIPMESSLPGESEVETLARLAIEEVQFTNFSLRAAIGSAKRVALCELNVGIYVSVYSVPILPDAKLILGSEASEVANLDWTPLDEIISEPENSLYFRPGNFEAISAHQAFQRDSGVSIISRYRFHNLKHRIPTELFNLVTGRFSSCCSSINVYASSTGICLILS